MSRSEARQVSHSVRINYVGVAGEEGPVVGPASKGFIAHLATILTSGMNGSGPFSNAIYLTSYGSAADSLIEGSLYGMTCKMIGTNDHNYDHFLFENAHRIDFGSTAKLGEGVPEDLMDKTNIIAMGIIVGIDTIKDPLYKGKTTVIATLKHTDYDPFTRMNVSWMTQHYIPPIRNMERAQVLCVLGREVQFTGIIRDFDGEKCMWASEVIGISVTSGHITNTKVSPKAPGKPAHGRIPLSIRPKGNSIAPADMIPSDAETAASSTPDYIHRTPDMAECSMTSLTTEASKPPKRGRKE
ncbi:hypothetical protein DFH28DRAFT_938269 [Melampsora americana]|nr:hypothetical protein DFH28DRAFT_938269 [Melampsora americana]